MRRIYLQSLKRGDSPGREGVTFFRSAQQHPQNWSDPGTLQVLSRTTAAKEEVEAVVGTGRAGFFYSLVSVVDRSFYHH